jgi:sortase A
VRVLRSRAIRLLSWLLLAGGVFLLISGAREFLMPIIGQHEISEQWAAARAHPSLQPAAPQLHGAFCRLLIPRLGMHYFVVQGTDAGALRIGPGHMEGSALPGQAGNCIIAGHRDTHFRALKDLRTGDDIILQTRTREYHYQVKHLSVVSPHDTEPLQNTRRAVLSLITCYPFYYVGPAPERYVVRAVLSAATPLEAVEPVKASLLAPVPSYVASPNIAKRLPHGDRHNS